MLLLLPPHIQTFPAYSLPASIVKKSLESFISPSRLGIAWENSRLKEEEEGKGIAAVSSHTQEKRGRKLSSSSRFLSVDLLLLLLLLRSRARGRKIFSFPFLDTDTYFLFPQRTEYKTAQKSRKSERRRSFVQGKVWKDTCFRRDFSSA